MLHRRIARHVWVGVSLGALTEGSASPRIHLHLGRADRPAQRRVTMTLSKRSPRKEGATNKIGAEHANLNLPWKTLRVVEIFCTLAGTLISTGRDSNEALRIHWTSLAASCIGVFLAHAYRKSTRLVRCTRLHHPSCSSSRRACVPGPLNEKAPEIMAAPENSRPRHRN